MIVTSQLVTNKKGFQNLSKTNNVCPLFCPKAFLEQFFYTTIL